MIDDFWFLDRKNMEKVQCDKCIREFACMKFLNIHKRKIHKDFNCRMCKLTFRNLDELTKHKETHPIVNTIKVSCSLCENQINKNQFPDHLKQEHEIELETTNHMFANMQNFYVWKESVEHETKSRYVQQQGSKKSKKGYTWTLLKCHRDGYYHGRGKNQRSLKISGSNKMNGYCPASMSVKIYESKVCVSFTRTHLGHSMDLDKLPLTKTEKELIAEQLALNIPMDNIISNIRDTVTGEEVHSIHLITRKDLHNIAYTFNIKRNEVENPRKNDNDDEFNDVDSWVTHMQQTTDIIRFYKPQGVKSDIYPELNDDDDFCLIIAHNTQLELLKEYGNDCLYVDVTQNPLVYNDVELFTISVLDDRREGIPCAFMFTNRNDTIVMQIYFTIVKAFLDNVELYPNFFLSDVNDRYFNAWAIVNPFTTTKQLYCTWYIDKDWHKNLNKITDRKKKCQTYKNLKSVMLESNLQTFDVLTKSLMLDLYSCNDTKLFAEYFQKYVNNPHTWAFSFRLGNEIDANAYFEGVHRDLKNVFLKGKKDKRLDVGIQALMQFVQDKIYNRFVALNKGKNAAKLTDLKIRHKNSLALPEGSVLFCGDDTWNVSSGKRNYTVSSKSFRCENCDLRCVECESCFHEFDCSCTDASIKWNMCKHIHLVCRVLKHAASVEIETENEILVENIEADVLIDSIFEESVVDGCSTTLEERKIELRDRFQAILDSAEYEEEVDTIETQMVNVESVLMEMKGKNQFDEHNYYEPPYKKSK